MAIAAEVTGSAARDRVHRLIKVGFSPRQAIAMEGSWNLTLPKSGFSPRVVKGLLFDAQLTDVADIIRKTGLTRAQAQLVSEFYH